MKIYKLITVLFLAALSSSCGEDFLVEDPKSQLGPDQIFGTESGVTVGVNGAYESLYQIWRNREHYMVCDLTTDDMDYQGGNSRRIEYNEYTLTSGNSRINRNWDRHYDGINRANTMIEGIPGAPLNDAFKNKKLGEVLFLRAYYYFNLVRLYGNVPLVLTPSTAEDDFYVSNTPAKTTYDQIIMDFETAMDLLPNQDTYSGIDIGRVGKGTAAAFLAKVYLTRASYSELSGNRLPSDLGGSSADYATAASLLERIIDGTMGSYALMSSPNEFYLESNEGGPESLFDAQMLTDFKNGWPATNWNETPNPFTVPGERGGFGNFLVTYDLLDSFEAGDKRLDLFYYGDYADAEGTIYTTEENERFEGDIPTLYKIWTTKMLDPANPIANLLGTNYPISRYSDVLLMFAEASNEAGGPSPKAMTAINDIRVRAELAPLNPALDQVAFRAAIRAERRVELYFEGHRRWDLLRWGNLKEVIEAEMSDVGITVDLPKHLLMPLSSKHTAVNPNLVQNPGYN